MEPVFKLFGRGVQAKCPDCGEETVFSVGKVVDKDNTDPFTLDEYTFKRLKEDSYLCDFRCHECTTTACRKIFWIDIGNHDIAGPLCETCFRHELRDLGGDEGIKDDVRVFYLRSNPTARKALETIRTHRQKTKTVLDRFGLNQLDGTDLF